LLREPACRDAQHAISDELERRVAGAVAFEGGAGAVGLVAVELDDETLGGAGEVGLEAVGAGVDEGRGRRSASRRVRNRRSRVLRVWMSMTRPASRRRLIAGAPGRPG
jgi:hypothetical protein